MLLFSNKRIVEITSTDIEHNKIKNNSRLIFLFFSKNKNPRTNVANTIIVIGFIRKIRRF